MKALAAALIAGGASKRFGASKAALDLGDGRGSLAGRILGAMRDAGLDPLFYNAPEPLPDLPSGVRVVPDRRPGRGPLEGLATVLQAVHAPVLVAACDMPGLDRAAFEALCGAWKPELRGLVARGDDGWHPLLGIYDSSLLPEIEQRLDAGRRAMHLLADELDLTAWPAPARWLVNVNTPGDWEVWSRGRS